MKKLFYAAVVALVMSSCASGIYLPGKTNFGMNTNVVLSQANFRIVRNLDVTIEINNTNLKRVDVEKSAYAELLRQANLTGSQALANVVVEEVRRENMNMFGFTRHKQYVSAHASVIEFLDASGQPVTTISESPKTRIVNASQTNPSITEHQVVNADIENNHKKIKNALCSGPTAASIRKCYEDIYNDGILNEQEVSKIQEIVMKCINGKFRNISKLEKDLKNAKSTIKMKEIFLKY